MDLKFIYGRYHIYYSIKPPLCWILPELYLWQMAYVKLGNVFWFIEFFCKEICCLFSSLSSKLLPSTFLPFSFPSPPLFPSFSLTTPIAQFTESFLCHANRIPRSYFTFVTWSAFKIWMDEFMMRRRTFMLKPLKWKRCKQTLLWATGNEADCEWFEGYVISKEETLLSWDWCNCRFPCQFLTSMSYEVLFGQ